MVRMHETVDVTKVREAPMMEPRGWGKGLDLSIPEAHDASPISRGEAIDVTDEGSHGDIAVRWMLR